MASTLTRGRENKTVALQCIRDSIFASTKEVEGCAIVLRTTRTSGCGEADEHELESGQRSLGADIAGQFNWANPTVGFITARNRTRGPKEEMSTEGLEL